MFGTTSDFELDLALALGLITVLVSVGLVLQVLSMRLRALQRERDRTAVQARWRPLLLQAALADAGDSAEPVLPPLQRRELTDVLMLWIQLQDSLRGAAHDGLNRLAQRLDFGRQARRWADRGSAAQRVIGLLALGHLGAVEDRGRLRAAIDDPRSLTSIAAGRALLQMDAASATPLVLDQYLRRGDWPGPRLGTLLHEAGADAVAPALIDRLLAAKPADQVRLLPLLRFAETPRTGSVLESLVQSSEDPQVLSMVLRQLHGPDALLRVRALCGHADALVRSAAAVALGRIGEPEDRERLLTMMTDRDWWVRYRSSQAMLTLPGVAADVMRQVRVRLDDRYARDMLDHTWAERSLRMAGAEPPARP